MCSQMTALASSKRAGAFGIVGKLPMLTTRTKAFRTECVPIKHNGPCVRRACLLRELGYVDGAASAWLSDYLEPQPRRTYSRSRRRTRGRGDAVSGGQASSVRALAASASGRMSWASGRPSPMLWLNLRLGAIPRDHLCVTPEGAVDFMQRGSRTQADVKLRVRRN
jgi:hypothetical protein